MSAEKTLIGYLSTTPRTRVWACDDPSQHQQANPDSYCWTNASVKSAAIGRPKADIYCFPKGELAIREWPEFTPVESDGPWREVKGETVGNGASTHEYLVCRCGFGVVKGPTFESSKLAHEKFCDRHLGRDDTLIIFKNLEAGACEKISALGRCYLFDAWDATSASQVRDAFLVMLKTDGLKARAFGDEGMVITPTEYKVEPVGHPEHPAPAFGTDICTICEREGRDPNCTCIPGQPETYAKPKTADPANPFAEAVEAVKSAVAEVAEHVKRDKMWGDMMTDRPAKTGPILLCGDPGEVRLRLDLLSDDRLKAIRQITDAQIEASHYVGPWPKPLADRLGCLGMALHETSKAISVGWQPGPYLQRVRDAHEAIGIEREWAEGKVRPANHGEIMRRGSVVGSELLMREVR